MVTSNEDVSNGHANGLRVILLSVVLKPSSSPTILPVEGHPCHCIDTPAIEYIICCLDANPNKLFHIAPKSFTCCESSSPYQFCWSIWYFYDFQNCPYPTSSSSQQSYYRTWIARPNQKKPCYFCLVCKKNIGIMWPFPGLPLEADFSWFPLSPQQLTSRSQNTLHKCCTLYPFTLLFQLIHSILTTFFKPLIRMPCAQDLFEWLHHQEIVLSSIITISLFF